MRNYCTRYEDKFDQLDCTAKSIDPIHHVSSGVLFSPRADDFKIAVDGMPAVLLRQAFRSSGLDENIPFDLGLDSKLVFARLLNRWISGVSPKTWGWVEASKLLGSRSEVLRYLSTHAEDYVVKRARGAGSNRRFELNRSADELPIIDISNPSDEQYILQERLEISQEIRVHTAGVTIIRDATDFRFDEGNDPRLFSRAEQFVSQLLAGIPRALCLHLVVGWDIALTSRDTFSVVEANFSGLHRLYRPGFQTSGFFELPTRGPRMLAGVLRALGIQRLSASEMDGAILDITSTSEQMDQYWAFYKEVTSEFGTVDGGDNASPRLPIDKNGFSS